MKSINGIYHCQPDPTDFLPDSPTFTGNASERTVTQLAKGGTKEQFKRQCNQGLSMVNDAGCQLSGDAIYELYHHLCKE